MMATDLSDCEDGWEWLQENLLLNGGGVHHDDYKTGEQLLNRLVGKMEQMVNHSQD